MRLLDRTVLILRVAIYPSTQPNVHPILLSKVLNRRRPLITPSPRPVLQRNRTQHPKPGSTPTPPFFQSVLRSVFHKTVKKANQDAASQKPLRDERRYGALRLPTGTGSDSFISFSTCACCSSRTWPEAGCRSPWGPRRPRPTCPAAQSRRRQRRYSGFACRQRRTKSLSRRRRLP